MKLREYLPVLGKLILAFSISASISCGQNSNDLAIPTPVLKSAVEDVAPSPTVSTTASDDEPIPEQAMMSQEPVEELKPKSPIPIVVKKVQRTSSMPKPKIDSPLLKNEERLPSSELQMPAIADSVVKESQKAWVVFGLGVDYVTLSQEVLNQDTTLKTGGLQTPSYLLKFGLQLTPKWGVEITAKETAAKVSGATGYTLANSSYNIRSYALEGLYSLTDEWKLRGGIKYQQLPFFEADSLNSATVIENTFMNASLGVEYEKEISEKIRTVMGLGYEQNLSSSSSVGHELSISEKYIVEGSLGAVYDLSDRYNVGIFWQGELHDYDFNSTNTALSSSFSGSQKLFQSTIDVRVGISF